MEQLLQDVKFNEQGLVPVIVQDYQNHEVLMFAWMNREALLRTVGDGFACYWSRSRQAFWVKGETSGHKQKVHSIRLDCDGDCVLLGVEQVGGACHAGYRSCFYRQSEGERWRITDEKVFETEKIYGR
jgi:phosphoribosyl-AMP cyclohydrolase